MSVGESRELNETKEVIRYLVERWNVRVTRQWLWNLRQRSDPFPLRPNGHVMRLRATTAAIDRWMRRNGYPEPANAATRLTV